MSMILCHLPSVSDDDFSNETIYRSGLACVTCLVGAFSIRTGTPILGVISQPFVRSHLSKKPQSSVPSFACELFWGINTDSIKASNIPHSKRESAKLPAVFSSSPHELYDVLKRDFDSVRTFGAGYKCLTVLLGYTDSFINASGGVYFWDLCGPHAILSSMGGSLLALKPLEKNSERQSVLYKVPSHFPLQDVAECNLDQGFVFALHSDKTCDILDSRFRNSKSNL